uniref:FCP1 homology domain-containing protein n=1 Tax=Coccolithus braarudii TaxID=221442 RepID=A0A7S0L7S9_9EUKA
MLAECSFVVWDFDLTILRIHAFGEGVTVNDITARWEADVADVELFRSFVLTALANGICVGIASFGRAEVILAYLQHIFAGTDAPSAFTAENIATPAALDIPGVTDGVSLPNGKPLLLEVLCTRANPPVTQRSSVLFFDDDINNVEDALVAGFTRSHHCASGFQRAVVQTLLQSSQSSQSSHAAAGKRSACILT